MQHDIEGKAYYTFEFVAKAPNFIRHALTSVCVGNGMEFTWKLVIIHFHPSSNSAMWLATTGGPFKINKNPIFVELWSFS